MFLITSIGFLITLKQSKLTASIAFSRKIKILRYSLGLAAFFAFLSYAPINWQYLPTCFYNLQFKWRFMLIGYFFSTISTVVSLTIIDKLGLKQKFKHLGLISLLIVYGFLVLGQLYQYSYSIRHVVKTTANLTTGYKVYNPHTKNDAWYFEYATTGVYQNQKLLTLKNNAWLNTKKIKLNSNTLTIKNSAQNTSLILKKNILSWLYT